MKRDNEKGTFKDKLKLTGSWIANHKTELAVASVVTGAIVYAVYKGQKQKMPPEAVGKILPMKQYLSTDDHNYRWALVKHTLDDAGNEITLHEVVEQLINGDFNQVDVSVLI